MDGFLPIFFLMVVLKIPVGLLLYLVWWAYKAETQPEEAPPEEGGDHRFRRFRREPKRPPRPAPRRPRARRDAAARLPARRPHAGGAGPGARARAGALTGPPA